MKKTAKTAVFNLGSAIICKNALAHFGYLASKVGEKEIVSIIASDASSVSPFTKIAEKVFGVSAYQNDVFQSGNGHSFMPQLAHECLVNETLDADHIIFLGHEQSSLGIAAKIQAHMAFTKVMPAAKINKDLPILCDCSEKKTSQPEMFLPIKPVPALIHVEA